MYKKQEYTYIRNRSIYMRMVAFIRTCTAACIHTKYLRDVSFWAFKPSLNFFEFRRHWCCRAGYHDDYDYEYYDVHIYVALSERWRKKWGKRARRARAEKLLSLWLQFWLKPQEADLNGWSLRMITSLGTCTLDPPGVTPSKSRSTSKAINR